VIGLVRALELCGRKRGTAASVVLQMVRHAPASSSTSYTALYDAWGSRDVIFEGFRKAGLEAGGIAFCRYRHWGVRPCTLLAPTTSSSPSQPSSMWNLSLPPITTRFSGQSVVSRHCPAAAGVRTPIKPEHLIPLTDLLDS
jgi:hypothetical protein